MATAMTVLNLEAYRRRSGVSLESIAESTKISSRFLRAIECEEFEKLPGGIFDTNYIRQYAAAIGFADREILNLYSARAEAGEREQAPAIAATRGWSLRSCMSRLLNVTSAERA